MVIDGRYIFKSLMIHDDFCLKPKDLLVVIFTDPKSRLVQMLELDIQAYFL